MKKISKRIILVVIVLSLLLVAISFGAKSAIAQTADGFKNIKADYNGKDCGTLNLDCIIQDGILTILITIGKVLGLAVEVSAKAVFALIQYGQKIITLPVVQTGFKASLDVANLLFILAIILIAFATILRLQNYGAKRMLGKLIIAVLLINFSVLIAGFLLDISNVWTNHFLTTGTLTGDDASQKLAGAFGPQKFLNIPGNNNTLQLGELNGKSSWAVFGEIMVGVLVALAMTFILLAVLIAMSVMTLVRNVWIAILLILMPVAWALWVLPRQSEHFGKWWSKFLKWVLFLPTVTFFVYLAISAANNFNFPKEGSISGIAQVSSYLPANLFNTIMQALIIAGLLVGALIAGRALGIAGAAIGLGIAGAAAGYFVGKGKASLRAVGGAAKFTAKAPFRMAGAGAKAGGARMAKATARGLSKFTGLPVVSAIPGARRLSNIFAGAGSREAGVEKIQKEELSNLPDDQFNNGLKHPGFNPDRQAAFAREAVKRKKYKELLESGQNKTYIDALKNVNPGIAASDITEIKEITKVDPLQSAYAYWDDYRKDPKLKNEWAAIDGASGPERAELERKMRERIIGDTVRKEKDVKNYAASAFLDDQNNPTWDGINIALNLSNGKIGNIAASGDDRKREALVRLIKNLKEGFDRETGEFKNDEFKRRFGNQEADIKRLIDYEKDNAGLQARGIAAAPEAQQTGGGAPTPPPATPKT